MGVVLHKEPTLDSPVLIACWPGIGNVGVVAVDTLRADLRAEEFGEIESWHFFYPQKAVIRNGELKELQFPKNRFYFKKTRSVDLVFFVAEEQPSSIGAAYAEGAKAYQMANLVLDVATKLGCRRVYTSGAAVAPIHHTARPRVWAVPNARRLIHELRGYANTVVMSDIEGRGGQGTISGLNGLLLGVAKKRGVEAVCLMGEVPAYLHNLPIPYPKASRSVLEVLTTALGITFDSRTIDGLVERQEPEIDRLYQAIPSELREQLDRLRHAGRSEPTEPGPITEEDKRRILEEIDQFFKKERKDD